MAENKGKFYMTTAIAYTSGKPHIGNTYEIILADAIARYKRAEGYDVYFQTGTDEHGQKIQEKAEAAGISPKEFVDQVSGEVKRIWDLVNSSYDNFVRTTDEDHPDKVGRFHKPQHNIHLIQCLFRHIDHILAQLIFGLVYARSIKEHYLSLFHIRVYCLDAVSCGLRLV